MKKNPQKKDEKKSDFYDPMIRQWLMRMTFRDYRRKDHRITTSSRAYTWEMSDVNVTHQH